MSTPPPQDPKRTSGPPGNQANQSEPADSQTEKDKETTPAPATDQPVAEAASAPGEPAVAPGTPHEDATPDSVDAPLESAGEAPPVQHQLAAAPASPMPQPVAAESTQTIGSLTTISAPRSVSPDDIVYTPYALSVGDGFKFGCGIVLAIGVAAMILVLVAALVVLIASFAGISIPLGFARL